jgi:large subunit ribosomal protein L35
MLVLALMPKQKTNRSAKKRFKISANGKISYKKSGIKHINAHMSARRKLRLRRPEGSVSDAQMNNVMAMFPYKKYAR